MGDHHPLCPGLFDGPQQAGPIGVVREHEATVHTASPSGTTQAHPAAGEGVAVVAKAAHPGTASGGGRCDDQGLAQQWVGLFEVAGIQRLGDVDARFAVHPVQRFDRAVAEDRADAGVQPMEDALGLAEGVAEQHAGFAAGDIGLPPVIDPGKNLRLGLPAVNRQAEGGFGDKGVATHRFEGRAGTIGFDLVVAGRHPDLALVFQAYLGRAQYMPGGMETQSHAVMHQPFTVGQGLQVDVLAQAPAQDTFAGGGGQVVLIPGAGVVAVGVGDDRTFHWAPGVDIKITGRAVEAFGAGDDKIHGVAGAVGLLLMRWGWVQKFYLNAGGAKVGLPSMPA